MQAPLTRRTLLRAASAAGAAALVGCAQPLATPAAAGPPGLRLIAETALPHRMEFQASTVGGLSGLDFDPASGLWVAISDDRSELQPARFYTLRVELGARSLQVEVAGLATLRDARGQPYPPRNSGGEVVDPEAIRLLPGGRSVLWTSEGEPRVNQHPAVHEARIDGSYVRSFSLPAMLEFGQRPDSGARGNLTLEGLALAPAAGIAWAAMEAALLQDGPLPKVGVPGGPCRFTAFDLASGRAVRQIAYLPDAIPIAPRLPGGMADNGVSEILMLDAGRMLVLERAFALGTGLSLRLYEIDTRQASDTLAQARLQPGDYRPAAKRLVADFSQLGLSRLDNAEGMCWGPRLPNGQRSLLVVTDDNFNRAQVTQFAAFEYLEAT